MILIAISWLYIFLTIIPFGFVAAKWLKVKDANFPEIGFLGLFSVTLFGSIWAFFGRINIEFHMVLFVLCLLIFLKSKDEIIAVYKNCFQRVSDFPKPLKILFWLTAIIILGQSAAAPFVLDNESYYIQTVKWLNEYGFVKGLANLHVLFAQNSGWHIAQSVYSFSFVYDRFNDLSGLCLLLGNLFAFYKLSEFWKTGDRTTLIFGLLPLVNVFFLRFSGAPSPDIPVYVITFIIADLFIRNFRLPGRSGFNLILALVLFVLYVKTSAVLLILLPICLIVTGSIRMIQWKTIAVGLLVLVLFIGKNCILSGYPLHPLPDYALTAGYVLPQNIADLYYIETKIYGYELTQADYNNAGTFDLLKRWISLPQLHGIVNRLTVILLLVAPLLIRKFGNKKAIWLLYLAMALQLALLLCAGPQYRYYLNLVLVIASFCATCILYRKPWIVLTLGVSTVASLLLLVFPLQLETLTSNENTKQTLAFSLENILVPFQNSKLDVQFINIQDGNLEFQSPVNPGFFWASGDGQLPCVSSEQLDYIQKYYGVFPQQFTQNPGDGFYSETRNY